MSSPRALLASSLVSAGLVAAAGVGGLVAAGCEKPPPIKSPSGEAIDIVTYEERFALSSDTHDGSFRAERLKRALEMMDKRGVLAMDGAYEVKGVVASSTLTLVVKPSAGKERKITLENCSEEHVCGFFADAQAAGVVERQPQVCKSAKPCDKK